MEKITIMIIDDHNLVRQALKLSLELDSQFEVVAIPENCETALKLVVTLRPEIILLDINMPLYTGFEMIPRLRNLSPLSKIIGLSAHTEISYARKMMQLGAKGYISKNATISEMTAAIVAVSGGGIYVCAEMMSKIARQVVAGSNNDNGADRLTQREVEILGLMHKAMTSKEIALQLDISSRTVDVHRYSIFKKLKAKNVVSAIKLYTQPVL